MKRKIKYTLFILTAIFTFNILNVDAVTRVVTTEEEYKLAIKDETVDYVTLGSSIQLNLNPGLEEDVWIINTNKTLDLNGNTLVFLNGNINLRYTTDSMFKIV